MGEQELVTDRSHQEMAHEVGAVVRWSAEQMSERIRGEALPEHRCGLQRLPIGWRQVVEARLDQALDRAWNTVLSTLLGVTQQLVEEQRVAGGPGNAAPGELGARIDIGERQSVGFILAQGAEIQGKQKGPA